MVREQPADEAKVKQTLAEAKEPSAGSQRERKRDALKLAAYAKAHVRESRLLRIKAGAAALVEGITVRPPDDEKAPGRSRPGGKPGRLKIDPEAKARRQAATGKALAGPPRARSSSSSGPATTRGRP